MFRDLKKEKSTSSMFARKFKIYFIFLIFREKIRFIFEIYRLEDYNV